MDPADDLAYGIDELCGIRTVDALDDGEDDVCQQVWPDVLFYREQDLPRGLHECVQNWNDGGHQGSNLGRIFPQVCIEGLQSLQNIKVRTFHHLQNFPQIDVGEKVRNGLAPYCITGTG